MPQQVSHRERERSQSLLPLGFAQRLLGSDERFVSTMQSDSHRPHGSAAEYLALCDVGDECGAPDQVG